MLVLVWFVPNHVRHTIQWKRSHLLVAKQSKFTETSTPLVLECLFLLCCFKNFGTVYNITSIFSGYGFDKIKSNKKALLCERKRHSARHVVSTCCAALSPRGRRYLIKSNWGEGRISYSSLKVVGWTVGVVLRGGRSPHLWIGLDGGTPPVKFLWGTPQVKARWDTPFPQMKAGGGYDPVWTDRHVSNYYLFSYFVRGRMSWIWTSYYAQFSWSLWNLKTGCKTTVRQKDTWIPA